MDATFSSEQIELSKVIGELTVDGLVQARNCSEEGWKSPSFEETLLEGFGALGIPESAGGLGGDLLDAAVATEAAARTVASSRFLPQLAALHLAFGAGLDVTPCATNSEHWSMAVDETNAKGPEEWTCSVNEHSVKGTKTMVTFAEDAAAFVVASTERVAIVRSAELTPHRTLDFTRPTSGVVFDTEPLSSGSIENGLLRAKVLIAADLCGVARGAVLLGADFARTREQFGAPIGSRQGVAFQLAEALVGVKAAWDLTVYAAWAAESDHPDAPSIVAQAKERAGRSAIFASERTIQVHGGMGITFDADPHIFLRRALFDDAWLGTGMWHRRFIGQARLDARSSTSNSV